MLGFQGSGLRAEGEGLWVAVQSECRNGSGRTSSLGFRVEGLGFWD